MRKDPGYSEDILLKGFRGGRKESFTMVFNDVFPALCDYVFRILRDKEAAEDISGETFIKVWEKRAIFFEYKTLKSYLFITARNAARDYTHKSKRQKVYEKEWLIVSEENERPVLDNLIRADVFRELFVALDKLPPQCKRVVSLHYVEGKSVREIALEMKLSIGTIKVQKIRGLKILRKWLTVFILVNCSLIIFS